MRFKTLIIAALLAGCGQSDKTVSFKDSEGNTRSVDVSDRGDTRTVRSNDGVISATGTKGGKNAVFPSFAPQYPGSTIASTVEMDMAGRKQHMIVQNTSDDTTAVAAFYRTKAEASGKKFQEYPSPAGPTLVIGGTSLMDADATIGIAKAGAVTSVSLSVQR
jgi:hypothetical protein